MAHPRLLILAYSFPPDVEVGGQRPARFCRYLPQYGIEPMVLSIEERYYGGLDRSFVPADDLRVQRTSIFQNPLRWYGAMKAGLRMRNSGLPSSGEIMEEVSGEKAFGIRDHAIACFQIPDGYWGWYWPAVRRARQIIRSEGVSAILSTSPPVTAHLIARSLKAQFGIPWIADFRDPWRDSRSAELVPPWYLRLSERIKRRTLSMADRIVCNTDRLRLQMMAEFPGVSSDRFVTLTNGFDSETWIAKSAAKSGALTFLHIGTLYGDRRIDGLARAIKRLRGDQRLPGEVKCVFLGAEEAGAREQVNRAAPELLEHGIIDFRARVPRAELRGIMGEADVLLLVQGDYELQIPAKFYEYLPTGLPMLAITKPGALSDIIQSTGSGICADPDDADTIAKAILRVLKMPPKSAAEVTSQFGQYHYRELTARLAEMVCEVITAPSKVGHLETDRDLSENECKPVARELEKR